MLLAYSNEDSGKNGSGAASPRHLVRSQRPSCSWGSPGGGNTDDVPASFSNRMTTASSGSWPAAAQASWRSQIAIRSRARSDPIRHQTILSNPLSPASASPGPPRGGLPAVRPEARHMRKRPHHPEPLELEVDRAGRRIDRRPIGSQQAGERFHLRPRPLVDEPPQARLGQPPASVQQHRRPLRLDPGLYLAPDVGPQVVAFQAVELERLVVIQCEIVQLEPHAESFTEEKAGGIGEEGGKIGKVDAAQGLVRLRQRRPDEATREFVPVHSRQHRLRCLAHAAGIAEQIPGGSCLAGRNAGRHRRGKVTWTERLEGVSGLECRSRETAAEVILQLVHQHRGRDRGVVAQPAPRIGHEETAPGREATPPGRHSGLRIGRRGRPAGQVRLR